jgi:hypothetical protein
MAGIESPCDRRALNAADEDPGWRRERGPPGGRGSNGLPIETHVVWARPRGSPREVLGSWLLVRRGGRRRPRAGRPLVQSVRAARKNDWATSTEEGSRARSDPRPRIRGVGRARRRSAPTVAALHGAMKTLGPAPLGTRRRATPSQSHLSYASSAGRSAPASPGIIGGYLGGAVRAAIPHAPRRLAAAVRVARRRRRQRLDRLGPTVSVGASAGMRARAAAHPTARGPRADASRRPPNRIRVHRRHPCGRGPARSSPGPRSASPAVATTGPAPAHR